MYTKKEWLISCIGLLIFLACIILNWDNVFKQESPFPFTWWEAGTYAGIFIAFFIPFAMAYPRSCRKKRKQYEEMLKNGQ